MSKTHTYSDVLRRDATRLAIFDDECGVEDFRIALSHDNKPVFFFEDGQYVIAHAAVLGGYVIAINGAVILHKKEIEELEDTFFDLIRNIQSMLRTKVTTLKMPISPSD
tara:strand:- start:591 stop:917 length:327 start_codon:yes stop_codon:yes gene_type:complete